MARYTKIPESNIAGTMGKTLGRLAGGISNSAMTTLGTLQSNLRNIVVNLDSETPTSLNAKLLPIETSLAVIEKSLNGVQGSAATLKTLITTLKVPVKALKASIMVIKVLPIPQMYLVVSITTVFSDLLEMLSELVAQVEEICEALESVVNVILSILDPVKDSIAQIRRLISLLRARNAITGGSMSDLDRKKLTNMGLLDSRGNNLLDAMLVGLSGTPGKTGNWESRAVGTPNGSGGFFANYGNCNINLADIELQNRVSLAEPGTSVPVPVDRGDWLQFIYTTSESQPAVPTTREIPPQGWRLTPFEKNCWYSKAVVSGKSGKPESWSNPEKFDSEVGVESKSEPGPESGRTTVTVLGPVDILNLNTGLENNLEGILKVASGAEAETLMVKMIDRVDKSSVSADLKNSIRKLLDVLPVAQENSLTEDSKYTYTAPDGTVYTLTIVIDSKSPSIAPRRYVSVTDPGGTVVLEGTKTFTTSADVLISEMKVRLGQLLG